MAWLSLHRSPSGWRVTLPLFYFLLGCAGSSLRCIGFSCRAWALEHTASVVAMWGLSAGDRIWIPSFGRWILNHWTTREGLASIFFKWSKGWLWVPFCATDNFALLMIRLSHHLTPRVLEKREHLRRSQKGTAQAHVVLESEGATETQPSLSRGIPSLPRISSSLQQLLFSHSVMSDFCDPMDRSMSGFPVLHQLPQFSMVFMNNNNKNLWRLYVNKSNFLFKFDLWR